MRKGIMAIAAAGAVLAGCSQSPDASREASDMSEPNVAPSSAPGVAWTYAYDYQLADEAIARVQEAHAAACEGLGIARCRITGLNYDVRDDKSVSASLEVKLAPDIARQFGKTATDAVSKADGSLLRTQFRGEDVAPVANAAGRQQSDVEQRIAALEKQLASARSDGERAEITSQLDSLRGQLSDAKATIAGASERLASTPMTFNYYGRGGIAGFKTNPVREAARSFVSSLVTMISFVLQFFALVVPWILLLALLVALARTRPGRAVRRFFVPPPREDVM